MIPHQVLIVGADQARHGGLAASARAAGLVVAHADDGELAAAALGEPGIDFLVVDLQAPDVSLAALRAALDARTPATPDSLDDAERRHITQVLRHTGGNKRQAALILGISRSTLLHKVRKYRIVIPRA